MFRSLRNAINNDNYDYLNFNGGIRLKSLDSSELTDLLYLNCSRGRFLKNDANSQICELLLEAGAMPCLGSTYGTYPVIYKPICLAERVSQRSDFETFKLMLGYCDNPRLLAEMVEYNLGDFPDFTRFLQIMLHSGYYLTANDMYCSQALSPFGYHTRLLLDAGFDGFEDILFDDGLMSHVQILGTNSYGVINTVENTLYVDMYLYTF